MGYVGLFCQQDTTHTLNEVFIEADRQSYSQGNVQLLKGQFKTMPASFQDPARSLMYFPGFTTENDQANSTIYHGMPSEFISWQLFGADIVNPNHLANAGTFDDLSSASGGGVNAFSGSMLESFEFMQNPADISIGLIAGGIGDLSMKRKINSYVDFNLIGLESGVNLNWGKEKKNNTYVSGRYSFVGILDKLGVNFGNEKINYKDLGFYSDLVNNQHWNVNFFGLIGNNENKFYKVEDIANATSEKDFNDITYKSNVSILGTSLSYDRNQTSLKATFIRSSRSDFRNGKYNDSRFSDLHFVDAITENSEVAYSSNISFKVSKKTYNCTFGLRLVLKDKTRSISREGFDQNYTAIFMNVNPLHFYTKFEKNLGQKTTIAIGFSPSVSSARNFESVSYNYHGTIQHNITAKAKLFGQFRKSDFTFLPDNSPNLIHSHSMHGRVGLSRQWDKGLFEISTFYSYFTDLPVFNIRDRSAGVGDSYNFNIFNGSNFLSSLHKLDYDLTSRPDGYAKTLGIDLFCATSINRGKWEINPQYSLSVFDSKFRNSVSEEWNNSKYNFGYISSGSISASKIVGEAKSKQLTYSLGASIRGGVRELQKKVDLSKPWLSLYDVDGGFQSRLKPYFRMDARIIYSWGKREDSFKHRLSLDIQNVLNRSNDAFTYYDYFLEDFVVQKQLGLIPVLSYRYEFL